MIQLQNFSYNIYMATKYNIFSNKLVEFSKKAAILEKDDEFKLINDWRDNRNPKSLQKILDSYLRLAVSYARKILQLWFIN